MLTAYYRGRTVVLLQVLVADKAATAKMFSHRRSWIGSGVLDVGPIHIAAGECEVGLDGFRSVVRVADDQPSYYVHLVSMQVLDGPHGGIAPVAAVFPCCILGRGTQELQISFQNVLDPQKT